MRLGSGRGKDLCVREAASSFCCVESVSCGYRIYLRVEHPQFHLIVDKDGKTNQPTPKHPEHEQ